MLAEIYRDEWGVSELLDSQVLRETQAIFGKAIEKGVPRSTPHRTAFKQRLKTSTDVFSAFRVHRCAQDVAAELTDEQGNRRSFGEWAERVQPYLNHQNRAWLQTEYTTAIRRAHDEADWVRFREDADIYPNLEWVPSTSAEPGADHKVFWGTVLPIGDTFWTEHRPGDRWNCKCSLRQTDKAPTATPRVSGRRHAPQPGLRAKPGSGEVFSDDHAYYPSDCRMCLFGRSASQLRHLLGNLGGKGGRTLASSCYECRYRAACMEKEAETRAYKEIKSIREDLSQWVNKNLPEEIIATSKNGSPIKARRIILKIGNTSITINKNSYGEIANKGQASPDYSKRIQLAKRLHVPENANTFKFVRTEDSKHHPDVEAFDVFVGTIDGEPVEIKIKRNRDVNVLWALRLL